MSGGECEARSCVRCIDCANIRESWEWGDGASGEYGCACTDEAVEDITKWEHCDSFEDRWEPEDEGTDYWTRPSEYQYGWIGGY